MFVNPFVFQIWLLKGSTQSLLPLDKLGQFKSTNAYLVEFKFQRWQTLFLWVGNHINYELNDNGVLKAAVDLCKKMNSKPELVSIYLCTIKPGTSHINYFFFRH